MNFTNTVKDYCIRQKLFSNGDRVLIGVSGGPDSIALLYTLYELRRFFGIQIYIAHLNHGLRKQAVSEQLYVQSLSKKLRIPFFTKTIKLKKTNASLEELARESRLKFFIDITKKININAIAVGHHQDDLAETVLMRALRGTGLFGARSILPRRIINGVAVIRPLLSTNRRAIKN
ncbi:MAG: tRNA lysidine(34) synthetase TilS [Candidatus Omnitrophica bacterium]|nr:tRNA lysidine(34) synthetase TilS [Candidatus Omnitrophota bacterium]